jgi:hypothetical protein
MAPQRRQGLSALGIPQPHRAVVGPRQQLASVRAPTDGGDPTFMAPQRRQAATRRGIPNGNRTVPMTCCEQVAIGIPLQRLDC